MKYWVITDTHFGHEKIKEYCGRPDNFEDLILDNLYKELSEDDILIHLGDICIGQDAYWHDRYFLESNYTNWLLRGNHDRKSNSWYHDHGWDFVGDQVHLKVFGKEVILSHKPVDIPGDFVNVHGHHHNNLHHPEDPVDHRHKLVYIEHHYKPVLLRSIIEKGNK